MDQKELEERIAYFKAQGHQVPKKEMIKTPEQIQGIRESAVINTGVLDYVASKITKGVSTQDIDDWVNEYTTAHGAICAPYHYEGYPKHVCTSINEVVCHGIPNKKRILQEGDIINVDVSTIYNGYFSDASRMFIIGETSPENKRLVEVTKRCLEIGIEQVKPFGFIGDIGYAIEQYAERQGFKVVRAFGGHGVGLEFHEEPMVLHYGKKNTGCLMVPGMVFTIEPMINMRKSGVKISPIDGWTATTKDGLPSAQWEHTLLVTDEGCEILTY
ncbi:MAG: type I methionyl aminopeptidase [Erysipelotrichaceae bacterium]|nr:type I methionyl aminopeptidase [Erysipelotrichaceae bacterium]